MIDPPSLAALFDGPVEIEAGPILTLGRETLRADEAPIVARAVDKRVYEVVTGRTYARRALSRLGLHAVSIPAQDNRAPRWPDGISGSITHTKKVCLVVVARRDAVGEIGIDAEEGARLPAGVEDSVLTPAERRSIGALPDPARAGLIWFSAKEAFYKAQSPITGTLLGFHDVEIEPQQILGSHPTRLRLRLLRAAGPLPAGFVADLKVHQDLDRVVTACTLRVPGPFSKST